jgi:PhnB protein
VTDDLDPLRRLRPDRLQPDEPYDPWVLTEEKDRLMAMIEPHAAQDDAPRRTPTIYPRLAYDDEVAALDFLTRVFGFTERREARKEDPEWGMLAWLEYGDGVVMIGRAEHHIHGLYSPRGEKATCMMNVHVDDVDAHYERAVRGGARIVMELNDAFYGFRRYEALDIEDHRWHFAEPSAHVRLRRGEVSDP